MISLKEVLRTFRGQEPEVQEHIDTSVLRAYHLGILPPGDQDAIQAHLAGCSDCAKNFLDWIEFQRLIEVCPRHLSAAEVDSAWNELQEIIQAEN